jgi:glycolate oxidase FAD binding subunit
MDAVLKTLANRVLAAVADGTTLCIRGGGTKDFYGETPEGEVLDTRQLTGITSYEPSELVVTVRAGTPLDELEAALAESGQCLAFEPPRFASGGTVGGMLSAGLSGPSRASVGAVRDYVLGVELLDGRAELLRFGGTVMKNVAGYDISRLLAGALGTLGVVTEVSLKVLPIATTEATLDFDCTQADALRLLNAWGGKSLPLNASLWRERGGTGCLSLRLRGATAAVEAACRHLGGERQLPERAAAFWQSVRDQQHPWFAKVRDEGLALWRVSVPQTAPPLLLDGEMPWIEWHGGQRWYRRSVGQPDGVIRAVAKAQGGHATLFLAPTIDGVHFVPRFEPLAPVLTRLQHALQQQFDPHCIFDRRRISAVPATQV